MAECQMSNFIFFFSKWAFSGLISNEDEHEAPLLCGCGCFDQNLDKEAKFDLNTRTRTRKTITRSVRLMLSRA